MRPLIIGFLLAAASMWAPIEAQVIPAEVGERLEEAVSPEEDDSFVGSYTLSTNSVVQKPNGKARHELELVMEVSRAAGGEVERRVVRAIRDGEDKTEEFAEQMQERDAEAEKRSDDEEEDEDGMEIAPRLPFGEDAALYLVSEPRQEGELTIAAFEPRAEHRDEERVVEGSLAWVTATLDPAWVEVSVVKPEKPLRELWMRMELERSGERLFLSGIHTRGLAKVLFFKRQFDVEVLISDIRLESPPAP